MNIDFASIDWQYVLPKLGIPSSTIENPKKNGMCPIEMEGHTRFRFDNKGGKGTWICNACGAGDGVRLVALTNGVTDTEAIFMIRAEISGGMQIKAREPVKHEPVVKSPAEVEKARLRLKRTWDKAIPIQGTPAQTYFSQRVKDLDMAWLAASFRYHESLFHFDDGTGRKSHRPALLSRVVDASNPVTVVTLHRTYINTRGGKADVSGDQVKKLMSPTVEKISGESIRLNTAASEWIIVTEGIENGLAWVAATKNTVSVFAALNAGNLAKYKWPKGTKGILIAGDNDLPNKRTGLRAGLSNALILRDRAQSAGLRAIVKIPLLVGIDWDDMWNEGDLTQFALTPRASIDQGACA